MSEPLPPPVLQLPLFHLVPHTASGSGALPGIPDSLIGREAQLAQLTRLIDARHTRLLTLTGAGGTGKTRLAIELATRIQDRFVDGVAFVPLAPISDPELVADAVARGVGLREKAGEAIRDHLIDTLRDRELLLLLDNFEHLLGAALVVASLLEECPRLTILVTSRAPLRLAMEQEVVIQPLALPADSAPMADIEHAASVRLYVEAARSVVNGFALTPANAELVAAICRRLDGLPLAIRLAASRSRVLDPESLLARLDPRLPLLSDAKRDAPARQRTMRDTIGWSFGLLREHEQILFRRLAVFAGGFTLDVAEMLSRELAFLHPGRDADAGKPRETPILLLDTLETLIDHHLVEREERDGDIRFTMLETIREYALEQLEASGEAGLVRDAHAAAITAWCERAKPLMFEADQARWLARGAAAQPNVRAALEWSLERGDAAIAHRLASANGPLWIKHAMLREAQEWLERILAQSSPAPVDAVLTCRFVASYVASARGDDDLAMRHARAGLELARDEGNRFGVGNLLHMIGDILLRTDANGAWQANTEALECMREIPGWPRVSMILLSRAEIAWRRGDQAAFVALAREAHDYAVKVEDPNNIAWALILRVHAAVVEGNWAEGIMRARQALDVAERIGSPFSVALALKAGAIVASASGDHRPGVRWFSAAKAAEASLGVTRAYVFEDQEQLAIDRARKVIGAKAVAAEETAAAGVPLATIADEVRHYRPGKGTAAASSPLGRPRLTPREDEVLRLVARGLSDPQIAEALFIARPTASRHVSNILAKLDVGSRAAAVDAAHRLGLVDEPGD